MIIESIVTTLDEQGQVNCAPMGVEWGDQTIVIKPYKETATYRNLTYLGTAGNADKETATAVVNLTDNVLLFAKSAIASPEFPTRPAEVLRGAVLQDVCSWREVEVVEIDSRQPRARVTTRVVHHGYERDFLGYNRARNAVLEAAILATRTRFLPRAEILAEFERLQVIVDKTAGPQEFEAMTLLTEYVQKVLTS
jgi:hypothetical protein